MRGVGGDESGSALIEFVLLAVVLVVPFVYAVLCVFEVQRAAYASTAAAREAGRALVTAPDGAGAEARARGAAALVLDDHGVPGNPQVRIECAADPCLTPGSRVTVRISTSVTLPLVPHWGRDAPASIAVRATHTEVVDSYRETRP